MSLVVDDHVAWMLDLERTGTVLCSGPLLSGPGVRAGSGVTVVRADDEQSAEQIASGDPFVQHGLRGYAVHQWRLNEGAVHVQINLGAGTFEWR